MTDTISKRATTFLLFVVLITSLAFTVEHGRSVFWSWPDTHEYSFEGGDFPMDLPLSLPLVDTTFEESKVFDIMGSDARQAWSTIHPQGLGYVHLGPTHRVFAVSTFHQLHCLVVFQTVLSNPENAVYGAEHVHHCLNYVRQMILCSADATLEPYDFVSQNFTANSFGFTRQCRDSRELYNFVNHNHAEWLDFLRANYTQHAADWWKDRWSDQR